MIQLVCHHYNPYPNTKTPAVEQMAMPVDDPKRTDFGPYQFITEKVLRKLNSPSLRLFGVDHIALAWMAEDREWTTEKGRPAQQPGQQHGPAARSCASLGSGRRRLRAVGGSMAGMMGGMMGGGMMGRHERQAWAAAADGRHGRWPAWAAG